MNYILLMLSVSVLSAAVLLLSLRKKSDVRIILSLMLFLVGCILLYFWLCISGLLLKVPFLVFVDIPLIFLLGPVLRSYLMRLYQKERNRSLLDLLQYLPSFFLFVFLQIFLPDKRLDIVFTSNHFPDYSSFFFIQMINTLSDIWLFLFILISMVELFRNFKTKGGMPVFVLRSMIVFTSVSLTSIILITVALKLGQDNMFLLVLVVIGIAFLIFSFFLYRNPQHTQKVLKFTSQPINRTLKGNQICNQAIIDALGVLMDTQMEYRDPDISIQSLSVLLDIKNHQLSSILNKEMHTSFHEYINGYRTKEAKLQLDQSSMTILDIAFSVGFNSKTTFNKVFLKSTGQTPTEYKNNL